MDPVTASDDVIDLIAYIELHRQEMGKESDLAAACNEALRKLHELLEREREALQSHGTGTRHSANIETVMLEIARVKKLAGDTSRPANSRNPRPRRHQVTLQSGARNFPRNKGRRTMGRGER
jgi:hypothetical protein